MNDLIPDYRATHCSFCAASAGEPCRDKGGVYQSGVHTSRIAAFDEDWNPVTATPGCDWCSECDWCSGVGRD